MRDGKPLLDDLCSGAGGGGRGYKLAGFYVRGIDTAPQPRYGGDEFHLADAMTWPLDEADAYHASPPCEDFMRSPFPGQQLHGTAWMLPALRTRLQATGKPWVIENVPGAPMRPDLVLCGCIVGLPRLRRTRWFETSWHAYALRAPCHHTQMAVSIAGHGAPSHQRAHYGPLPLAERQAVIGIDWMTKRELGKALPPAYTMLVGELLMQQLACVEG